MGSLDGNDTNILWDSGKFHGLPLTQKEGLQVLCVDVGMQDVKGTV